MTDEQLKSKVLDWIAAFELALSSKNVAGLRDLLCDPAYLRDNGALTWDYRQFHGREAVVSTLTSLVEAFRPHAFRLAADWPSPSVSGEGDTAIVEAFFDFKTKHGSAVLLVNARETTDAPSGLRARAIFTRLEGLDNVASPGRHPRGRGYKPDFPGQTWQQHRNAARAYGDKEPDVLVVGAGQAGLVVAAYLRRFGVNVLNVDRHKLVGDSWAKRYDTLALHNPVEMNGFPFLPFPAHYPEYLSKDAMGDWLELYARYTDLNVWTETEFRSACYDDNRARWEVLVSMPEGRERKLKPQHIVLATGGIGGKPAIPKLLGLDSFAGKVMHSSEYARRSDHDIEKAIIVGVATSAHDIARDLHDGGVDVTLFQRGPVVVNNVATANLAYSAYMDPEIQTKLVDIRYGIGLIDPLRVIGSKAYHEMAKAVDAELLTRLTSAGLRLGDGVNGQGWLDLFLRSGGGYYLNTGTSELIADGKLKIEQFDDISRFMPTGALMNDGRIVEGQIVVLATGYQSRRTEVLEAFGPDVADRVGDVARLDEEGEWANMWSQTGQRGLWFNGGGINQMRPGSERLALLIKADLDGLIGEAYRRRPRNVAAEPARELIREAG